MEVSQLDSSRNHKSVAQDSFFEEAHRASSNLNREMLLDQRKSSENIHHKNINSLVFVQLNVNSLRNKFDSLQQILMYWWFLKQKLIPLFAWRNITWKAMQLHIGRSSSSDMFFKIGVFENFAIFTGKHLCWSLFLINLQTLRRILRNF